MDSFSGLLNNAALMMVLCVIYDTFGVYAISKKNLRDYFTGILVGLISIIVMLNPWSIQPGVFFDTRWVLLSLCGLFFGIIPTTIAVIIAGSFRLYQGGPGGTVGTVVIVVTACVGLAWKYWKDKHDKPLGWKQLYAFGVVVQLAMLSCVFLMPAGIRISIIKTVGPPILIIYPVLTMLIGLILKRQEERRDIEKEISQRKSEFEAIFNSITDAIVFVDIERRAVMINPSFTKIVGYKTEEILGQSTQKIYANPEEFTRQGDIRYSEAAQNIKPVYEIEYRRKDGTVFPAETLGTQVRNSNGQIIGFLGIIRDITPQKEAEKEKEKMEEQLRQAHKMEAIGTLSGGIAHDFNNILAIILGHAELALNNIPAENPARHNIEKVLKASKRAINLVEQILAFGRKERKELIPVPFQSMIKETLKLLRSTTPATISIVKEISQDCGMIMADPTQLHQLLMNLFVNAVHAMDEKGEVTVSLQEVNLKAEALIHKPGLLPGRYACLSVSDSGTGMDRDMIDRIFDPFYTTKDVGKGTGLGLSVVHGIVERHGGFIDVESQIGRGSTFNVFLPVTEEEEILEVETSAQTKTGSERILLVDDETMILEMAEQMLKNLGYEVMTESSSVKALEIFKSKPDGFDLIITDQSMPNISGSELVAEILKAKPGMPIILCTGYSTKVSPENVSEKGISKYMTKPYSSKELAKAIREVLNGKL